MRRTSLLLISLALGCSAAAKPGPAPPKPAPAIAVTPAIAPAPARTCDYAALPAPAVPEPLAPDGACRGPDKQLAAAVHRDARKRWSRQWPSGRLEIRDGCDRLDPQLDSVALTTSSGHGGSLTLAGLERRPDGDYALTLLEYNHYTRDPARDPEDPWQADSAGPLEIYRGTLSGRLAGPLLAEMRLAAHLEITEHEPPPKPGTITLANVGISSNDYHVDLQLRDARGRGVQRHFAGYAGSGDQQKDGVPLAIVRAAWFVLLDTDGLRASFTRVTATDPAARELFARGFARARARGDDFGYWYVRERLLGVTALLGSDAQMPALLAVLNQRGDDVHQRSQVLATNAIAAITGHDVRHDPTGAPRPVARVVAETLAACTAPASPPK